MDVSQLVEIIDPIGFCEYFLLLLRFCLLAKSAQVYHRLFGVKGDYVEDAVYFERVFEEATCYLDREPMLMLHFSHCDTATCF